MRNFTKKEIKSKNSDEEIIRIALSRLGEGNYDLLKNNCEHFVNECVFNDEILVTQGLEENIYTEMPEETETDYKKADKEDI